MIMYEFFAMVLEIITIYFSAVPRTSPGLFRVSVPPPAYEHLNEKYCENIPLWQHMHAE